MRNTINSFGAKIQQGFTPDAKCGFADREQTLGFLDTSGIGDGSRGIAFMPDGICVNSGGRSQKALYKDITAVGIISSYESAYEDELEISLRAGSIRITDCSLNKLFLKRLVDSLCRLYKEQEAQAAETAAAEKEAAEELPAEKESGKEPEQEKPAETAAPEKETAEALPAEKESGKEPEQVKPTETAAPEEEAAEVPPAEKESEKEPEQEKPAETAAPEKEAAEVLTAEKENGKEPEQEKPAETAAPKEEPADTKKADAPRPMPIPITEEKIEWLSGKHSHAPKKEDPPRAEDTPQENEEPVKAENTVPAAAEGSAPAKSDEPAAAEEEDLSGMSHDQTISYLVNSISEINSDTAEDNAPEAAEPEKPAAEAKTVPAHAEETPADKTEDASPQNAGEVSDEKTEEASPEKTAEVSAEKTEEQPQGGGAAVKTLEAPVTEQPIEPAAQPAAAELSEEQKNPSGEPAAAVPDAEPIPSAPAEAETVRKTPVPELTAEPESSDIYIQASRRLRALCEDGKITMARIEEALKEQLVPAAETFSELTENMSSLPPDIAVKAAELKAASELMDEYFAMGEDIAVRVMFYMLFVMLSCTDRIAQTPETKRLLNLFFVRYGPVGITFSMLETGI